METPPELKVEPQGEPSSCSPRSFNPCVLWSKLCIWYLRLFESFFSWFGEEIAKRPLIIIQICLVFVSVSSVGFVWFRSEGRTVKLYIPQESNALDDLETAQKYFLVNFREEIVLLEAKPSHPNVLSPECLRQAFHAHKAVVNLESYSDFCVTLSGNKSTSPEDCVMTNPLEFLQFNESNLIGKDLTQVQLELSKAANDTSWVTRNGRPFRFNLDGVFGSITRTKEIITGAKALQMIYLIRAPSDDDAYEDVFNWETKFIEKIASLVNKLSCFEVHYSSERSMDDAIDESTDSDVTLVSITFTLMISFACIMLGKFFNPLTGHFLLAVVGVFAVALGILGGLGLGMWFRVPFVSFVGILPFLVLGIGIDDMFIMVDELDRLPRDLSTPKKIKAVMRHTGTTVTMTTITDLVAFAVSTSTSFPAVRYFCIYTALTVTFSFFMIVTFFVAFMTYDVRRIKSGRRDCFPLCLAPRPKDGEPAWDEPVTQTSNRVMKAWGKFLMSTTAKSMVIIVSLALLNGGIYGVTQVDEAFDERMLAKDDSYYKQFLKAQQNHFELTIPVSIVETGRVDYKISSTQEQIKTLTNIVTQNEHYGNTSLSWMDTFSRYAEKRNKSITGPNFFPSLKEFLRIPAFSHFRQDLKFTEDGSKLEASRILGFMKGVISSTFQKNAMLTLREEITVKSKLDAFPINRFFIYFEQYAITSSETVRNLLIATLAVLVITSPFLMDCAVTFLVVLNFVALICELFGLMVIWNVSLNSVSMIILVMAIGFAVDYSAHIAHAYITSDEATSNGRVVDALSTLGASVFMGGFSTFLGMVVLSFAASEIFRIFFKMFFGIVLLGLFHGLCVLPVYLSLLWWRPSVIIRPPSLENSSKKLGGADLRVEAIHIAEKEFQHGNSEERTALGGSNKQASQGEEQETDTAQGLLPGAVDGEVLTRIPDPKRETRV